MASAKPVTSYVALLRGINVGGNNVIPMSALARTFEGLGLASVKTYIASGNVLFASKESDARALERRIEKALTKAHDYDATVVLRTRDEMASVIAALPRAWKRVDPDVRYNVIFLRHEIDSETILERLAPKPDLEQVSYARGVLFWSSRRDVLARTAMVKLSSSPIYRQLTVRNLNTTKKIFELMRDRT